MADIDMQRKSGGAGWLAWLAGLLVLAMLVWWLWPDDDTGEFAEVDTVETVAPAAEVEPAVPPAAMAALATAAILTDPETYIGQRVSGTAQVVSVPTDRGFWIEAGQGQRLFVVLDEMGDEVPVDVNQGMTVQLDNALVRGADEVASVSGDVDDDTRAELEGEQVFLTIDDAGITLNPQDMSATSQEAAAPVTGS